MSSPAPLLLLCGIKTTFYRGQCRARPPCTRGHPLGIPHQLLWPWGWHGDRDKVHELGQCQDKHLEPPARPLCRRSHPFLLLGMAREHRHTPASARPPPTPSTLRADRMEQTPCVSKEHPHLPAGPGRVPPSHSQGWLLPLLGSSLGKGSGPPMPGAARVTHPTRWQRAIEPQHFQLPGARDARGAP